MELLKAELTRRLQSTSKHFLLHALEHALADEKSQDNALQTISNIQAALELLTKLYLLRVEGWTAIAAPSLHAKTEKDLLTMINDGSFKTIAF